MEEDEVLVDYDWNGMRLMLGPLLSSDGIEMDRDIDDEDAYLFNQNPDHTYLPPLPTQHRIHIPQSPSHPNSLPPTHTYTISNANGIVPRGLQTVDSNGQPPQQDIAPPLLPAFLITGLLLGAIVFIIIWRRFVERRRSVLRSGIAAEEEDVWGVSGTGDGDGMREKPKMWEAFTVSVGVVDGGGFEPGVKEKWEGWESVMPLSATPFFRPPKRQQPRYLIPSDRPTTFMTRMFGGAMEGYRFNSRSRSRDSPRSPANNTSPSMSFTGGSAGGPLISSIAYTNRQGMTPMGGSSTVGGELGKGAVQPSEEDRIEKVLLSFVVAMPFERERHEHDSKAEECLDGEEGIRKRKSKEPAGEDQGWSDELPEVCLGSLMIPYG